MASTRKKIIYQNNMYSNLEKIKACQFITSAAEHESSHTENLVSNRVLLNKIALHVSDNTHWIRKIL